VSRIAVFLLIVVGVIGGIHTYIWFRLVRDTALPQPWRLVATIALAVLALSIPASFFLRRGLGERAIADLIYWPAMVWLGVMFILLVVLVATDLVRLVLAIVGARPSDPARRVFLRRLWGGAIAATGAALGGVALYEAAHLRVKDVRVPLARLPAALDGMTIAQITDVHIGPTLGRAFIEELVARTNALEPDIVAITGDLVDATPAEIGDAVQPLAGLRARRGVFFVTGNHEYYAGVDAWLEFLPTLGIRVLRNERVAIADGLDLAGVDDYSHGQDLERALAGRDERRELVLLAHQPRAIHEAAEHGVGLQLSGHTHGGQIWPFKYLVYLQQPFVAGLARARDSWIYVSCGTGFWGPPMRLGAPPEITRLVLTRA
jgi:predicted MPP superfamily phosphohydrolase